MTRAYRTTVPLLGAWLAAWMYISWPAIQDDALIHLRYADNLHLHHFITYDGVHAGYGASSLLYVSLLALLRSFTASADLPRAVSSVVHGLLFVGLASALVARLPTEARVARLAGLTLLVLLVTPSAVRWLDDGMETGMVVAVVSLLAWLIHGQFAAAEKPTGRGNLLLGALAFLAVLLRTELGLLCGFGFLILAFGRDVRNDAPARPWQSGIALLAGAALAVCFIFSTMHVLLPDTALAKSHGIDHWFNPIRDAAITLGGAFLFGVGMLAFWLLTLLLVRLHHGRLSRANVIANAFFPVVLTLASLRGQEIQGVRYFAWTFVVSILWNILELARAAEPHAKTKLQASQGVLLLSAFLVLIAIALPFETKAMHRVLTRRGDTMRTFEAQHLDVLRERRGVASDIGYIGYFSGAQICDLAGLVNGRAAARLTSAQRNQACVQTESDFVFGNASQLGSLRKLEDFSGWQVCGRYEFTNVKALDTHYLVVRPAIAEDVCRATGSAMQPLQVLFVAAS